MIGISILAPFFGALVIFVLREEKENSRLKIRNALIALTASGTALASSFWIVRRFATNYADYQLREVWWGGVNPGINVSFALDGLSFPLFLSTCFLFFLAALFSLNVFKLQPREAAATKPKIFWGSFLLLESIVLAVFSAWNFILFFAAWELFLIPLVILLWRFGLEDRRRAALKFFLYTFVSSAFMVAAFAALVYYMPRVGVDFDFKATLAAEIGIMPPEKQKLIFAFFMIAFLVKMPLFPLHAWLPLTHTQAPLGTLLLSGLFLKLGSYGVLRFVTPNFFGVMYEWGEAFQILGIVTMFYGAFAAYRQNSFRYIIAYSSLAHMGLIFAAAVTRHEYALTGAMIQNVGHSLANALLFVIVCMHLVRNESDGTAEMRAPRSLLYWAGFSVALFSAIGVPGTVGFTGEFLMLFGLSFKSWPLTIAAVMTLILGAAYMLRLFHLVRSRAENTGWRPNAIEGTCIGLLVAAILWFGVNPSFLADSSRTAAKSLAAGGAYQGVSGVTHK